MGQTTPSAKERQPHASIQDPTPESPQGLQDASRFSEKLDVIAQQIKELGLHDPSFNEKFLSVQTIFEEIALRELSCPVNDWEDFRVRLQELERAYKQERFSKSLKTAAVNLYNFIHESSDAEKQKMEESIEYWRANTLLYELHDIFHVNSKIKEEVMKVGERLQDQLYAISAGWEEKADITPDERRLIKEKVIYVAGRANELKRAGELERSLKLFLWLLDFTTEKLKTDRTPLLGIRANLSYHVASVYRLLEQHDLAEEKYTKTLNLLHERTKLRRENDYEDHFFTVRKQAMAVGIGFGWVNLTRGFLRRAENALTTARSLLARSSDPIIPSYIELLYGTVMRCRAGSDKEKLQDAIKVLRSALSEFEKHKHTRYHPRACWELSLALHLAGKPEEAQAYLDTVAEYAKKTKHPKWQTNVFIQQSRIFRGQGEYQKALKEAKLAVEKADSCKSMLPLIDAYITRGEANFYIIQNKGQYDSNYSVARADFEHALNLLLKLGQSERKTELPSNPKIASVCHLRIAQCYTRENDAAKAREHFAAWEVLRSTVEHEWVRELAEQVKNEIEGLSMNFTISAKDLNEWDYSENVAKLRRWLLSQALLQTKKNFSKAADLIGVKRATLYQWQEEPQSKSKRARVSGNGKKASKKSKTE